jgi:hypothetical protein
MSNLYVHQAREREPVNLNENPFRFTGPLDPDRDRLVCAPRADQVNKVVQGIERGDYWSVTGPRQIGKTTFLNQLQKKLARYLCIYINFEMRFSTSEAFYEMIRGEISERASADFPAESRKKWQSYGPEYSFYNFLRALKPKNHNKKIVFLFDEIGKVHYVKSFLSLWRKVYHDRQHYRELERYAVVISGTDDLIALSYSSTSPFNISRKLILNNLDDEEAGKLIARPMKKIGIDFDPGVGEDLIQTVSGHPQLLQHLCYLLVENAGEKEKSITASSLDNAVRQLLVKSDNIKILQSQVNGDPGLRSILEKILAGGRIKYLSVQEYSTAGAGPVIEGPGKYCTFRCPLYREFLSEVLEPVPLTVERVKTQDTEFVTTIYCAAQPFDFASDEEESDFLRRFFKEPVEISIEKNGDGKDDIDFPVKEKLLFCYLAYKNYKAINEGIPNWKKIPRTYNYRVSSAHERNEAQAPEWNVFREALQKEAGVEHIGDSIRAWIYSIRERLAKIDASQLILSGAGRGSGYLLKGAVVFKKTP